MFVVPGSRVKEPISAMPGQFRFSADSAAEEAASLFEAGIKSILLFGIPEDKDGVGSSAFSKNGVVQNAIQNIRSAAPDIFIITDVCLCEYTDHGHCGVLKNGRVDNDSTLELLAKMALSHANAGADMVAPSDMMDGRVAHIRAALDKAGFSHLPIMSYSAKYASAFYGPFREAAGSAPRTGDRRSYQMDTANAREALKEIALDIEEGADIVMVKPALAYLDVIAKARERFDTPIAAYNVSGEYSMIKAAAEKGWINEEQAIMEALTSIKRAGADIIITYFAKEIALERF
jgi:porphobilinogen synthase